MKKWILKLVLSACLWILNPLFSYASQPANSYQDVGLPITQTYDPDDFNAHVQNWAVRQAVDGRILVGNGNGLLVWDGELWHRYSTPNQSRVRDLLQWHDGRIYIGTVNDIGYYSPDAAGVLQFTSLLDTQSSENSQFGEVWSIAANDDFIIFSSTKAIFLYDGESLRALQGLSPGSNRVFNIDKHFVLFPDDHKPVEILLSKIQNYQDIEIPSLPNNVKVRDILPAPQGGRLIVTSQHGIYHWQASGASLLLKPDAFGDGVDIYTGFRASDGYYYLGSRRNGLFILDPEFNLLRQYGLADGLGLDTVLDINEDNQGGIWLSGLPGVSRMMPAHQYSYYGTRALNIGQADLLNWRGIPLLAGFSIYTLAPASAPLTSPNFTALSHWERNTNFVLDLGTTALVAATGGVFELKIGAAGSLLASGKEKAITKVMFANHLLEDKSASTTNLLRVYAATSSGLFRLQKDPRAKASHWESKKIAGIDEPLLFLSLDPQGNLWVGTSNQRIFRLPAATLNTDMPAVEIFSEADGLGPNNVYPFVLGNKQYFGTDGGLFDFDPTHKPVFQPAPGFPQIFHTPELDFYRWLVDSRGNFWYRIGNHTGVAWRQKDGPLLADEQITQPLPFRSATGFFEAGDGAILIAQADGGVYRIGPDVINARGKLIPPEAGLAITEVNNLDSGAILFGGNGEAKIPRLPAAAGSIRIRFALSDFSLPEKTLYRSRFSGSDRWSDWQREIWRDFTRLKGGDYQFELQARDGWGREQSLNSFHFMVMQPWYLSLWAWLLYAVLLLLALVLAGWLGQRWRTARLEQRNLELQHTVDQRTSEVRAKVEELKQTQELKDRFFANVSHEFRTPLTLTIEPLEEVMRGHAAELDGESLSLTKIALRNARKMLSLIGEVLDINRLEAGSLRLLVAEHDFADLLRRITQRFQPWIKKQHQTLVLKGADEPVMLYFDQDQLDRVVSNLLSNAIKYSGAGSNIKISLEGDTEFVDLRVSDNGPGIAADKREKVFERYYQDESSAQQLWPGTGIGLALVREFAELHHGTVVLEETETGASFRLRLRRGQQHFDPLDLNFDGVPQKVIAENEGEILSATAIDSNAEDVTTVLVVDDNAELRHFLALRLAGRYKVLQAENGRHGVELAIAELPDLVISDLMMPEMDGLGLTDALRNNPETATIPIILLTAKSTKRDTVAGIEAGADDYLTKPFDTSELIARVAGLIASRKLIRVATLAEFQLNDKDGLVKDRFLQQFDQLIMEHLQNSDINVQRLAELMNMDRSSLYRKCQKSTGVSPIAYLRKLRMQVAARLLQENSHSISEVAYATGFESISYFSRVFKAEYDASPGVYAHNNVA